MQQAYIRNGLRIVLEDICVYKCCEEIMLWQWCRCFVRLFGVCLTWGMLFTMCDSKRAQTYFLFSPIEYVYYISKAIYTYFYMIYLFTVSTYTFTFKKRVNFSISYESNLPIYIYSTRNLPLTSTLGCYCIDCSYHLFI